MAHAGLDRYTHLPDPFGLREQLRHWLHLPNVVPVSDVVHVPSVVGRQGFLPLLLSTALAEVAGNMVYVSLLERAYQLGGKAASVGGVLLIQSVLQVLLGIWAGSMVDRLGKRRAATLATLAYAALAAGLVVGQTILAVYVLASLIALARLVLIPARLTLVPHVSSKGNLVAANTAFAVVAGLGLFLGPAISAALIVLTDGFQTPLFVAGLGLLLSAVPLLSIPAPGARVRSVEQVGIWREMRSGWQYIRKHGPVSKVLLCLVHYTLIMGAAMPLITPLAHKLGLGSEGTGVFFSAVGLGGLIGAPLAIVLFKRVGPSMALLLSGLLVPVGLSLTGLMDSLEGALAGILLAHMAAASLNIIVVTILQRLTPLKSQGSVFGVVQTLLGLAWVVSLGVMTGGMALWPGQINMQALFLLISGVGLLLVLVCWLSYRRDIQIACGMCEPRIRGLGAVCRAICMLHLQAAPAARWAICGSQCKGCHWRMKDQQGRGAATRWINK